MVSRKSLPRRDEYPSLEELDPRRRRSGQKWKRRGPWYRHTTWFVPLVACVAFAVLIAGAFGVRQIVVLLRGANAAEADGDADAGGSTANGGATAGNATVDPLLKSSEPGMDVLPPKAPRDPGRKLPKMLLVGDHPEMFPSLEAAMKLAVPGDVIEIRTNRVMVVKGAELKLKQEEKGAPPLKIRAGGLQDPRTAWQPVLRGDVALVNVDLKMAGLHFAKCSVRVTNGDLRAEQCTFTQSRFSAANLRGVSSPRQVTIEQCFVRDSHFHLTGPAVSVNIDNSGFSYSDHRDFTLALAADEQQQISIQQSTFFMCYLLRLKRGKSWPKVPLSFRMKRSLFGIIAAAPHLVQLNPPASHVLQKPADHVTALQRAFRVFKAADNLADFWGVWAAVGKYGTNPRAIYESVFREFPASGGFRFGKKIEQMRFLIFKAGKPLDAQKIGAALLPEDLMITASVELAKRTKAGLRYGCDVTKLPVPPPATLQP